MRDIVYTGIEGGRVVRQLYFDRELASHEHCRQHVNEQEGPQAPFGSLKLTQLRYPNA